MNGAKRDDIGSLRSAVIQMIPLSVPAQFWTEPISPSIRSKVVRGFNHPATGRLLCPRAQRDEFDVNPNE